MSEKTVLLDTKEIRKQYVRDIVDNVSKSLTERGYNVISQLSGYLISNDPAYITSYNNARNEITKVDRYEILETVLEDYLNK